MKGDWDSGTIDELCDVQYGTRVTKKADSGTIYPVYGGGGETFRIDRTNRADCLVVSRFGMSPECTRYVQGEFFLNDSGLTVVPRNPSVLRQEYLDKHLIYLNDRIYSLGRGSAQKNLNVDAFRELRLLVPPLAEQNRIVAILDEAFEAVERAEKLTRQSIRAAGALHGAAIADVIRSNRAKWPTRAIAEIAQTNLGKMLDKSKNRGAPRPYLRNLNVRWFGFDLQDLIEMRFEDTESDRFTARRGDLLICEGGYPGRAAIWDDDQPIHFQKAIHRVRFHEPVYNRWLLHYLYYMDSSDQLCHHFTGSGIQHFTGRSLKALHIPLPPADLCDSLCDQLDEIRSTAGHRSMLDSERRKLLRNLKQSLLSSALSGTLAGDTAGTLVAGELT